MAWLSTNVTRLAIKTRCSFPIVKSFPSTKFIRKISSCPILLNQHQFDCLDNVKPLYMREEHSSSVMFDGKGEHSFKSLVNRSFTLSEMLLPIFDASKKSSIKGERVALLCPSDSSYVVAQWATWMSGGVVVPLCPTHPPQELEYFITDSGCKLVLYTEEYTQLVKEITKVVKVPTLKLGKEECEPGNNTLDETRRQIRDDRKNRLHMELKGNKFKDKKALIIYTSGTTGRPKVCLVKLGIPI